MGVKRTFYIDRRVLYLLAAAAVYLVVFAIGGKAVGSGRGNKPAPIGLAGLPTVDSEGRRGYLDIQSPDKIRLVERGEPPRHPDVEPVARGAPRIWLDADADGDYSFDLGSIPAEEVASTYLVVKNLGDGDLLITRTNGSCGCTAVVIDDAEVPPGGSTTLRIHYDPRVNGEQDQTVTKRVWIHSNDPMVPIVELTFTADVEPALDAAQPGAQSTADGPGTSGDDRTEEAGN